MKNPWKTLESKVVYKNPWISVREDQVLRPNGTPGIYSVVETRIATGVVALAPGHEIYLVGQYRYPMDEYSWEIVEGGAEDDETPLAAAQRELEEEAGLRARQWEQLGAEVHLSNCHSSERGFLFMARELETCEARPDDTEVLALKKTPFAEALAMVERGEIKDAMSIIAILRMQRRFDQ